jgi:hypothetical protein
MHDCPAIVVAIYPELDLQVQVLLFVLYTYDVELQFTLITH